MAFWSPKLSAWSCFLADGSCPYSSENVNPGLLGFYQAHNKVQPWHASSYMLFHLQTCKYMFQNESFHPWIRLSCEKVLVQANRTKEMTRASNRHKRIFQNLDVPKTTIMIKDLHQWNQSVHIKHKYPLLLEWMNNISIVTIHLKKVAAWNNLLSEFVLHAGSRPLVSFFWQTTGWTTSPPL